MNVVIVFFFGIFHPLSMTGLADFSMLLFNEALAHVKLKTLPEPVAKLTEFYVLAKSDRRQMKNHVSRKMCTAS